MLYERDDSGFVIVSIYPANTDNRKPIESSITLDIWLDPIKLNDKSFLKKHWNDLMAYMENTSLDGNPTFLQRQRVSYLRTFKNLVVDNKWCCFPIIGGAYLLEYISFLIIAHSCIISLSFVQLLFKCLQLSRYSPKLIVILRALCGNLYFQYLNFLPLG